jgi:WD40 repeat protein
MAIGEVDGTLVMVIGLSDGTVLVRDLRTGTAHGKPLHRYGGISAVAIGEVGRTPVVVTGGADGTVQIWDLRTGTARGESLHGPSGKVSAVAIGEANGSPVVASGDDKGRISMLAVDPQQGVSMRLDAPAAITAIAFADQIGWLTSTKDGSLFMWRHTSIPGRTPYQS